jgi:hypothetical protein
MVSVMTSLLFVDGKQRKCPHFPLGLPISLSATDDPFQLFVSTLR